MDGTEGLRRRGVKNNAPHSEAIRGDTLMRTSNNLPQIDKKMASPPRAQDGTVAYAVVFLLALALRSAVGRWGHSGEASPPMFGDFEAQRHWMEITTNLPIGEW